MQHDKDSYQSLEKTKISNKAIISFILAILSPPTLMITAIPAIILGFISLKGIKNGQGKLKGKDFAIAGICIPIFFMVLLVLFWGYVTIRKNTQNRNLSGIEKAMQIYGNHGQ